MTRKTFIDSHWKPYPSLAQGLEGWLWGRVLEKVPESQTALATFGPLKAPVRSSCPGEKRFGQPVPWDLLQRGDVVGLSPEGCIYLLAPNLSSKGYVHTVKGPDTWAIFLSSITGTFTQRGFHLGRTPFLVPSPGVDHHIHFLKVEGCDSGRHWSLPTSPEMHLKKLLCQGAEKVYEIKTCFRDDWIGPQHQVEFVMLEWYRAFGQWDDLLEDFQILMEGLKQEGLCDLDLRFRRITVAELFRVHLNFSLKPNTTREELLDLACQQGLTPGSQEDWNTLFSRLFLDFIEPHLGSECWDVVTHWPTSQSSLARVEGGWALRFELYWQGVELGNAYVEENSPHANKKVFQREEILRKEEGSLLAGADPAYFEALEKGMPPAVGIALGLDRLFALTQGGGDIGGHRPFPEKRQEGRSLISKLES